MKSAIKKVTAFLLVATIFICNMSILSFANDIVDSGKWGENVTWKIDNEGVLTVSGNGKIEDNIDMFEYEDNITDNYPGYYEHYDEITKIVISEGITEIGKRCFEVMINVDEVEMANTVKKIGDCSFGGCFNLKRVKLSDNLVVIGEAAFSLCVALEEMNFPSRLRIIKQDAFTYTEFANKVATIENCIVGKQIRWIADETESTEIYQERRSLDRYSDYNKKCAVIKNPNGNFSESKIGYYYETVENEIGFENARLRVLAIDVEIYSFFLLKGRNEIYYMLDKGMGMGLSDYADYLHIDEKPIEECGLFTQDEIDFLREKVTEMNAEIEKFWSYVIEGEEKIDDFTIIGYKNSTAEQYAKENGFKFISFEEHKHSYRKELREVPTCQEKGNEHYICICGDEYEKEVAQIDHIDIDGDGICEICDKKTPESQIEQKATFFTYIIMLIWDWIVSLFR